MLGVALQVDGDVDIEIEQQLGHFAVAAQHHVVELVERLDQPRTDLAAVVGTVGDAQHLESLPVVELEQLRDLPARRMAIEGRREIGDPDLSAERSLGMPDSRATAGMRWRTNRRVWRS